MKKKFLVVSPHPDDAELGIGGSIIKLRKKGHKVYIVDLTSGEPTPCGTEEKRKKETDKATKVLDLNGRFNLGLENRYLFDSKEARMLLAERIRLLKPDVMLVPHSLDAHPDHVATSKIAEGARFYAKYTKTKMKGAPHYTRNLFYYFASHLRKLPEVSFLVDTTDAFKAKMRAVACYRSQFVDYKKNSSIFDYIEFQNKYLGALIGAKYAEALCLKEMFSIEEISPFA